MEDDLQKRIDEWKEKGKREDEVTWGMLDEGFRSLAGIPDDFCSAEDPKDRESLWDEYQERERDQYIHDHWDEYMYPPD